MKKALGKLVTLFLIITLVLCTVSIDTYAAEDYRTWKQGDERWGSIRLGSSRYTMKKSGCLVTSVSKMLVQSGVRDVESFNPGVMVEWLNDHGGLTSSGALSWIAVSEYSGLACKGEMVKRGTYSSSKNNARLISWLKDGYHLILNVDDFGHFVVVDEQKSLETGQIYIMDSISAYTTHDVKLTSRYPTFNRVIAYTGGRTPLENLVLEAPEILNVSVMGNELTVSWGDVSDASKYKIHLMNCDQQSSRYITTTSTYYTFRGLTNGKWAIRIGSVSTTGKEAFSPYEYVSVHVHGYDNGVVTKNATCASIGTKTYTCTSCKETKVEAIKRLDHSYDAGMITTAATKDAPGVKTFTCTVCKATKTENFLYDGTVVKERDVKRIWGKSRYYTSLAIADELKEALGVEKFETVIIASSQNFPDAMAGSYLAAKTAAPVLMVNDNATNTTLVLDYIKKNVKSKGTVYVLGGASAVPESIEDDLSSKGYRVERLKGKDRYETNLAILKEAGVNSEAILVCTGDGFADSLSASATGLPILLVNANTDKLTTKQIDFLDDKKRQIYIVGGSGAVSDAYRNALKKYDSDGSIERVKGASRYETSVAVAKKFSDCSNQAIIASATDFPDGLCGGPLAYYMDAPLILTGSNTLPAATYVSENSVYEGYVLGGTVAVKDEVAKTVFYLSETETIQGTSYN